MASKAAAVDCATLTCRTLILHLLLYANLVVASTMWITDMDEKILEELNKAPNLTDPTAVCDKIRGIHDHQKRLCYNSPQIMLAIGEGNRRTLEQLQILFEEDNMPPSLLLYKSLFSFWMADGSKRETLYLASLQTSSIAHELAVVCSDGLAESVCPCYRPPSESPDFKGALEFPLILDLGCPYALAHAQRLALNYVLYQSYLDNDTRQMIKQHVIAAVRSIEAGWIEPEEEWERKLREMEEKQLISDTNSVGSLFH